MQVSVKRVVLCSIVFLLSLLTLLALNLPVVEFEVDIDEYIASSENIFDAIDRLVEKEMMLAATENGVLEDTGFSLLENKNQVVDGDLLAVGNVLCIIQLTIAIFGMVFSIASVFIPSKGFAKKLLAVLIVINMLSLILYTLLGFKIEKLVSEGLPTAKKKCPSYISNDLHIFHDCTFSCTTLAFVALIIGVLLLEAYLICNILIKEEKPRKIQAPGAVAAGASRIAAVLKTDRTATVVSALKQYKDLLDAGIITDEEFEAKKKELLNK